MTLIVTDPRDQQRLIEERKAMGGDRFDEVWEGDYVMAPIADNEHQDLAGRLVGLILQVVGNDRTVQVLPGTNITDRESDWEQNYRCPDVAVFLAGTTAQNRRSHWLGGPDFAVEILSPGDRTPKKLPFYASVNVRELLVISRDPWWMELFRLRDGHLVSVGKVNPDSGSLASQVLPASLRLIAMATGRPEVEATHSQSGATWRA